MGSPGPQTATLGATLLAPPSAVFETDLTIAAPWVGSERDFLWLEKIVKALLVLNALDAILTLAWIAQGCAIEANPILCDLAHHDPLGFVLVKTGLVSLGVLLLWRHRARPLSVVATFVAFLTYFFLLLYHLSSMRLNLAHQFFGL